MSGTDLILIIILIVAVNVAMEAFWTRRANHTADGTHQIWGRTSKTGVDWEGPR